VSRPPTREQMQALEALRKRIRGLQDEAHAIRYPDGSYSDLRTSLMVAKPNAAYAVSDGFDALLSLLVSLERQVEAAGDLPDDGSTMLSRARRRSLPPERDDPPGEGDASHTVPVLAI
jgi:hypothetical protein